MPLHIPDWAWSRARANKYRAKGYRDSAGLWHASKKEGRLWSGLQLREQAGAIRNLRRQVRYPLTVNDVHIADYIADFVFEEEIKGKWREVVLDVKSPATQRLAAYRMKRKLMRALYRIEIEEV